MVYPAKKDAWAAGILLIVGWLLIAIGIFMMYLVLAGVIPLVPTELFVVFFVPPLIGMVILWIVKVTEYEITTFDLIVRFGPFRWKTPLERIVEVVPTRKLIGRPGWGFALSLDRLDLSYRRRNGKLSRLVLTISPQDKTGFVRELAEANLGIRVQEMTHDP
jgi:hypothetical protein